MSRSPNCSAVLLALLIGSGCRHRLDRPNIPSVIKEGGIVAYSKEEFTAEYAAYKKAIEQRNLADARVKRDAMINRIEADVESNYREFESKLATTRASLQTGSDVVELGASAAIGVVGASDVKDLLAAALTGFKGARLSFEKNFFREKTTEILISQMQAYRESIRNRITDKVSKLDVSGYPFEEAWRDLVEFFYAGTLQGALQQLANETGKAAAAEKAAGKQIDVERANTAEEAQAAIRIRQKYAELAQLAQDRDPIKQESARNQLQQILVVLGEPAAAKSADVNELLKALRERIQKALTNPADIPMLDKTLTPAPQL